MATTYQDAKAELKMMGDDDPWASAMGYWFAVACEIFHMRPDLSIPPSWEFKAGLYSEPGDEYEEQTVRDMPDDDLMAFGMLVDRYCRMLTFKGCSY